jgi:hypothetical protein
MTQSKYTAEASADLVAQSFVVIYQPHSREQRDAFVPG